MHLTPLGKIFIPLCVTLIVAAVITNATALYIAVVVIAGGIISIWFNETSPIVRRGRGSRPLEDPGAEAEARWNWD